MRQKKSNFNSLIPGADDPISESEILANEKRTRFSLSNDQDSIGVVWLHDFRLVTIPNVAVFCPLLSATSDILEATSEAASSHSVETDSENDNLSDMVSANVSGRGTPSISGRDTPLSQAAGDGEGEGNLDERERDEERRVGPPELPVTIRKNNRVDVTDKFQKFEIERELECSRHNQQL